MAQTYNQPILEIKACRKMDVESDEGTLGL